MKIVEVLEVFEAKLNFRAKMVKRLHYWQSKYGDSCRLIDRNNLWTIALVEKTPRKPRSDAGQERVNRTGFRHYNRLPRKLDELPTFYDKE